MTPNLDIRPNGRGQWYIASSTGQPVSPPYSRAELAISRLPGLRTQLQRAAATPRKCLCCPTVFASTGKENRLCDGCRGQG
jgi:hypothetical protein